MGPRRGTVKSIQRVCGSTAQTSRRYQRSLIAGLRESHSVRPQVVRCNPGRSRVTTIEVARGARGQPRRSAAGRDRQDRRGGLCFTCNHGSAIAAWHRKSGPAGADRVARQWTWLRAPHRVPRETVDRPATSLVSRRIERTAEPPSMARFDGHSSGGARQQRWRDAVTTRESPARRAKAPIPGPADGPAETRGRRTRQPPARRTREARAPCKAGSRGHPPVSPGVPRAVALDLAGATAGAPD